MDVDTELDRLYGLPLDEFTPARDALARELRRTGEREAAQRVKALRKPPISAWTVNQLARKERMQVRSLVTAGERLRTGQAELLRGGAAADLQEAFERQREVVSALVESGEEILRAAGHPATDATLERVRRTLNAAAGDEEGERLLQGGRLTEDLDPAGFGPLALGTGMGSMRRERAPSPTSGPSMRKAKPAPVDNTRKREAERRRRIEEAKREADRLRAEVRERRRRAEKAEAEATRAAREAEALKNAAEEEERQLKQAKASLNAAEEVLRRARSR